MAQYSGEQPLAGVEAAAAAAPDAETRLRAITLNGHNSTQSSPQKLILDWVYKAFCALSDGGLRGPWKPPKMPLKSSLRWCPPRANPTLY